MKIFIKSENNRTLEFKVEPNCSIGNIKTMIESHLGIPAPDQILKFVLNNAELILDDEYNLEFYGIANHSCLCLKLPNERRIQSQALNGSRIVPVIENIRSQSFNVFSTVDPLEGFFNLCKSGNYREIARELEYNQELAMTYSSEGWTAIHYAAYNNYTQLMELLFGYKINVNQLTRDGNWAALHLSCIKGHLAATDLLLRHKNIIVDNETDANSTPLHCACMCGSLEIVDLLLQAKANYSIENKMGQLPVEVTVNKNIKDLLCKYMGDTSDLPETFEGFLSIPKLIGSKKVWAVLKPLEGELCLFANKDKFRDSLAAKVYKLNEAQEIKRCKDKFNKKDGFRFQISMKMGKPNYFIVESEEAANVWVRNIFGALLYRQNRSKTYNTKYESALGDFSTIGDVGYDDFEIVQQIGNGSFGVVYLAKKKNTEETYALKAMLKEKLIRQGYTKYAIAEVHVLSAADFPFILKLHYSFQTARMLYLALDYCPNGSLSDLLQKVNYLPERYAKIYIAELIVAIEYLHENNVIFRDLKPENIMFDNKWHIKLVDFGLAKENMKDEDVSMSFCGSPAYLSPEMLNKTGINKSIDIYGIGCILYEMLSGYPPYYSENMTNLLHKIVSAKLKFPHYVGKSAKNLIKKLLNRDTSRRPKFDEIKSHEFLSEIDWESFKNGNVPTVSWEF